MQQKVEIFTALLEMCNMPKRPEAMDKTDYQQHIDELREKEFPSMQGTTYLDHAGTTIYSQSFISRFCKDLMTNLYGNPHSASPSSALSTQRVDGTRSSILRYFDADPELFDVVFTANATAAIKLVAEALSTQSFWLGYHRDAHSSIVGMRELAAESRCFDSSEEVESWIEDSDTRPEPCLVAYPAQSNMTGHRPSLLWPQRIRKSHPTCLTLLDAASFLTTGNLDLSNYDEAPDFVTLSFYKIFGFPDLGALIVRKDAFHVFDQRRFFGGGTVGMVISIGDQWHARKTESLHDRLEDGTLPFHNIIAVDHAITTHRELFGLPKQISHHTSQLMAWLFRELSNLQHFNGSPVIRVHKDQQSVFGDPRTQGPILAFSVLKSNGNVVGKSKVEALAVSCEIHLRTGGVCNPGGIATMLNLEPWEMRRNYAEGMRCGDEMDIIGGKPTGIIRVSLGAMTTFNDVQVFAQFVRFFFVESHNTESTSRSTSVISEMGYRSTSRHTNERWSLNSCPRTITPIFGCASFEFPVASGESVEEAYLQYQPWHDQWLLVDPDTLNPINSLSSFETQLQASIDAPSGILHVKAHGSITALPPADLQIDTNSIPPNNQIVSLRPYDAYPDPHVQEWFTTVLRMPTTLARRRADLAQLDAAASRCAVSRCQIQLQDRGELAEHYNMHSSDFNQLLAINGLNREVLNVGQRQHSAQVQTRPPTIPTIPVARISGLRDPELQRFSYEKPRLPWMQHEHSSQKKLVQQSPSVHSNGSVRTMQSVKMAFRKLVRPKRQTLRTEYR